MSLLFRTLSVCALLVGCDTFCQHGACGPCPAALSVTVTRADGTDPTGVSVAGVAGVACGDPVDGAVVCGVTRIEPGTYPIQVVADGEAPVDDTIVVVPDTATCCSCGTVGVHREIVFGEVLEEDAGGVVDVDAGDLDAGDLDAI